MADVIAEQRGNERKCMNVLEAIPGPIVNKDLAVHFRACMKPYCKWVCEVHLRTIRGTMFSCTVYVECTCTVWCDSKMGYGCQSHPVLSTTDLLNHLETVDLDRLLIRRRRFSSTFTWLWSILDRVQE